MQREVSLPLVAAGVVGLVALIGVLWYVFLGPRGAAVDPALARKAQELRRRERTLGRPASAPAAPVR